MMALYTGILLIALPFSLLSSTLWGAVKAEVETEKGYQEMVLKEIEDNSLVYRPPDVERGVEASLPLEDVQAVIFDVQYDTAKVFKADQEHRWASAARTILESTLPALPFLALPDNNAVEPLFQAGKYLERAAHFYERRGEEEDAEKASKLYQQSHKILSGVAKAEWNYLSEPAALKALACKVALGDVETAAREFRSKRVPQPYDGAYGQYWLTKARILLARGEARKACDAVAKTVVFDNKNVNVFPDALLFFGNCHEEITEYHRARDIYYEAARLFPRTEWGNIALQRLEYIMDNGLTADREKSNIAKVFFGIEEDMNAKANELLEKMDKEKQK